MKRNEEMKGKRRKTEVGGQEAREWGSTAELDQFSFTETKAGEKEGVPICFGLLISLCSSYQYSS